MIYIYTYVHAIPIDPRPPTMPASAGQRIYVLYDLACSCRCITRSSRSDTPITLASADTTRGSLGGGLTKEDFGKLVRQFRESMIASGETRKRHILMGPLAQHTAESSVESASTSEDIEDDLPELEAVESQAMNDEGYHCELYRYI